MTTLDTEWQEMLSSAVLLIDPTIRSQYHQVLILHTIHKNKIEIPVFADTVKELKDRACSDIVRLSAQYGNEAINRMVCVWANGSLDAPAFDVMQTLCGLNAENRRTTVLLCAGEEHYSKMTFAQMIGE